MKSQPTGISTRWGGYEELAESWVPISHFFLQNYHRLKPNPGASGLSSTEAMLIVHLMSYKWDQDDPYPSVGELAKRLGVSRRQARHTIKTLEDLKLLRRKNRPNGGTNAYDLSQLFDRLMELYAEDLETAEAATEV